MIKRALAVLSVLVVSAAAVAAGPKVDIPGNTADFGKTVQKAVLTHSFWIRSTGDDTLRILEIEPGCGCTKAPLTDSVLAPGDSTTLHIVFSTGRFVGHVDKRPYIVTNASAEKVFLKILAELETEPENSHPVVISPPIVDVSQFGERPRRRARFLIENRTDSDLKISVVDSSFKSFVVEIPDKVKAGDSVPALVIVSRDAVETAFEESITLEFNDQARSRYSIPIKRMYRVKKTASSSAADE